MKNILFIDDNKEILNLYQILYHKSYNVYLADSLISAENLYKKYNFNVHIVDYNMPNMEGLVFLEKYINDTPVIILSGEDPWQIRNYLDKLVIKRNVVAIIEKTQVRTELDFILDSYSKTSSIIK